jgi:nicotinamide mononucleotide transporter
MSTAFDWNSLIEPSAALLSLLYLYLEVKEKSLLWLVGILSSCFYALVMFKSHFYADFGLNVYYVLISVYGWIHWNRSGKTETKMELPISRINIRLIIVLTGCTVILYFVLLVVLLYLPQYLELSSSSFPYIDSFTVAASIVATWMLARKILEQWWVWILVNGISTYMFFLKGLNFIMIVNAVYTIGSVVGLIKWHQNYKSQPVQI